MMPRSDENMKELAKDLGDLVLEHKALIARYEERLDGAGQLETDDLIRSQIEFLVLNVRAALVSKEQELRQVNSEVEYRRQMEADRENFRPGTPPARPTTLPANFTAEDVARLTKWPAPPKGAIERAVYSSLNQHGAWMLCYRFPDQSLVMAIEGFDPNTRWDPGDSWRCDFLEPIEGAGHAD